MHPPSLEECSKRSPHVQAQEAMLGLAILPLACLGDGLCLQHVPSERFGRAHGQRIHGSTKQCELDSGKGRRHG